MSLLLQQTDEQLLALLQRYRDDGMSEVELEAQFGKPPHWFEDDIAPRYSEFVVHWRDAEHREYMDLRPGVLGVRLPIKYNRKRSLQFPYEGQTVEIVQKGGGNVRTLSVRTAQTTRDRTATAWIEYDLL